MEKSLEEAKARMTWPGTTVVKIAPMFVHFGKIGMVRNNEISRKSGKIT